VDTFAESHYIVSAAIPGSISTDAETDKCQKYNDLLDNYYFQPVAIKTTGEAIALSKPTIIVSIRANENAMTQWLISVNKERCCVI